MATITELVTSCINLSAAFAGFDLGLDVTSTLTLTSSTPTHPTIGQNVASTLHLTDLAAPSAHVTVLAGSTFGSRQTVAPFGDDLESTFDLTSVDDGGMVAATEDLMSHLALTSDPADQIVAQENPVSTIGFGSEAILDGDDRLTAYWTNAKTFAAAVWLGLPVDSFAFVNDTLMASGDNLLAFGPDDDAGTPIAAEIRDDWRNLGEIKEKRFESGYVSAKAAGPMKLRVETLENGTWDYTTHLPTGSPQFTNHRAVFGRGLVGEYARISFLNINGKDFDVAAITIYAWARPRRIGG